MPFVTIADCKVPGWLRWLERPLEAPENAIGPMVCSVQWQIFKPIKPLGWLQSWTCLQGYLKVVSYTSKTPLIKAPFTLAHLTDVHYDWNTTDWLEGVPSLVKELSPDGILLTGDYIAEGATFVPAFKCWLEKIKQALPEVPVFACLGNHDYMDGQKSLAVQEAIKQAGVTLLNNEAHFFQVNTTTTIMLAALDDYRKGNPQPDKLKSTLDELFAAKGEPKLTVLLCHNPKQLKSKPLWPLPTLVLSGHTHGGQFSLPGFLSQWLSESPYVRGFFPLKTGERSLVNLLYVSNGIATASICKHFWPFKSHKTLPIPRIGTVPELTLWRFEPA